MIFSEERIDIFMAEEMLMDRAMYKKVKAMDREHLEQTFRNVYKIGYDAAKNESAGTVDLEKLRSDLKLIKGVGEARLNEIMAIIEIHLNKSEGN